MDGGKCSECDRLEIRLYKQMTFVKGIASQILEMFYYNCKMLFMKQQN